MSIEIPNIVAELRERYPRCFEPEPTEPPEDRAARERFEGEVRRREDLCRRRREWETIVARFGRRAEDFSLDTFEVTDPAQRTVVDALRRYAGAAAENIAAGRNIVLYGGVGSGKTHLLFGTAREILRREFHTFAWICGAEFAGQCRDVIDNEGTEDSLIRRWARPDVLLLDDPIPAIGPLSPFQAAQLGRVIDARYRALRPTFASMNARSGKQADEVLGAPLVDRLRDNALCLACTWPSHRRPSPN